MLEFSIFCAIYFGVLYIIHNEYSHARKKLEVSYEPFPGKSKEIPTKKQVELLEKALKIEYGDIKENRKKWLRDNLNRYKRVRRILVTYTFGVFKFFE